MIETIDVAGVRALHDRVGAREAGRLLIRGMRDKPTRIAIEDLRRLGVTLSARKTHRSIWTALDADGKTHLSAHRLSMRETWPVLPATVTDALVGQPVTRLLDHAVLDDMMIIDELHVDDERDSAEITLSGTARPLRQVMDRLREGMRP